MVFDVNTLSDDKIYERIDKIQQQRYFYHMMQKANMVQILDSYLEECYSVLDERSEIKYFDEFIGRNEGIVVDTTRKSMKDDDDKSTRRKRRFGGDIQRATGK